MPYATAEQQAERDELVARILAAAPGGLTKFEVSRRVRAELGMPTGIRTGNNTGADSLRRLEAAGRIRSVEEPWACPARYRRLYSLTEEGS